MENETGLKMLFWVGTAIMVFAALGVLVITLMYQQKVSKIRQKESENLLDASLESEKRERKRIAADIHDSISGDLNAMRNYITILNLKEKNPDNKTILKEIRSSLENMLEDVQHISYNLMPPLLESHGLVATLNDYFHRVKKLNHVEITSYFYQNTIALSGSDAYELFRIIQEFVANMLKHGKTRHIDFSILKKGAVTEIHITDDGIRYDFYEKLKNTTGMGLKNILSRMKYIGASLEQIPTEDGNKIIIRLKNT